MDEPEVTPPVYEKKVGRPPKARKKQPQEIQGKYGPKLSKHGVVMHCSWCDSTEHNVRTCGFKKAGIKPDHAPDNNAPPYVVEDQQDAPPTTENAASEPDLHDHVVSYAITQQSTTMLSQMLSQTSHASSMDQNFIPVSECAFIQSNQPTTRPIPLTTTTKAGKARMSKSKKSTQAGDKRKSG
ncbi:unnamed protein product, partial [Urochloa humidicola]